MSHKAAVRIAAALGIPLFPLGAHFFLAKNEPPDIRAAIPVAGDIQEIPAAVIKKETQQPTAPEILALAFSPPEKGTAGKKASGESAVVRADPVPGDGKFSYLGLIRESNTQEWLCVKEEETGRVLFVDAKLASANEDRWALEIEGVSYSIGRN
ncbi:MAG: hypothetical protein LBK63_13000 [Treponema sp.]|jgi:hypothetical protein|nr:hypothetical protein [Treponema sp.]